MEFSRARLGFAIAGTVAAVAVAGFAAGCGTASLSDSVAGAAGSSGQSLSPASVQNISGTGCVVGEVRAFASPQLPPGYIPANGATVPANLFGVLARAYNATGDQVTVPDMSQAVLPSASVPILWGVCVWVEGSAQWNTSQPRTLCPSADSYWLMPTVAAVKMPTIANVGAVTNLPGTLAWYECGKLNFPVGQAYIGSLAPFDAGAVPSPNWVLANGGSLTSQLAPLNYMLVGQANLPNLMSSSGTGPQFAIAFRGVWP